LGYAITKKIRHISKIHICDKYKIVIDSPEVQFVISRSHAEVGHKNIIIFSYKKSFRQILHKYKINHIKIFTT
jgi:hypothetical protein